MKISVICTVKNEEKTINELISSLLNQTRKPNEIIFVDGGSTDNTLKILKKNKKIKTVVSPGANIAKGRNLAVQFAKSEWIASIDGGCVADRNWLKNLEKKFTFADVVSGVYVPLTKNKFEELVGRVVCKPVESLKPETFLPSSRSVAFKKEVWESVGGYPEEYYTAEDTLFDLKIKEKGFRFALAKDAVVKWRMRSNLKDFAKQFFLYGKGDGESGLIWKLPLNFVLVVFTLFSLVSLAFGLWPFFLFLIFIFIESVKKIKNFSELPLVFLLVLTKRVFYVLGVVWGFLKHV